MVTGRDLTHEEIGAEHQADGAVTVERTGPHVLVSVITLAFCPGAPVLQYGLSA